MYNDKGELREELFLEDRLHINQEGYDLWKAILKPVLMEAMPACSPAE
ncbi:MAG: hypothetical protein LUF04_10305 [Bacteroides sp.]|nr:hypothetical protein [Bacteroides sp.]